MNISVLKNAIEFIKTDSDLLEKYINKNNRLEIAHYVPSSWYYGEDNPPKYEDVGKPSKKQILADKIIKDIETYIKMIEKG